MKFVAILFVIASFFRTGVAQYVPKKIVDSGAVSFIWLEETTAEIPFNMAFNEAPQFALCVTSLEVVPYNQFIFVYDASPTPTKASLEIYMEWITVVKIRWMASKGEPVYLQTLLFNEAPSHSLVQLELSSLLLANQDKYQVAILMSGFQFENNDVDNKQLYMALEPKDVVTQTSQQTTPINFSTKTVSFKFIYEKTEGTSTKKAGYMLVTLLVHYVKADYSTGHLIMSKSFTTAPFVTDLSPTKQYLKSDFIFGFNLIDMPSPDQFKFRSIDFSFINVHRVYLTSVEPQLFRPCNNVLFMYEPEPMGCTAETTVIELQDLSGKVIKTTDSIIQSNPTGYKMAFKTANVLASKSLFTFQYSSTATIMVTLKINSQIITSSGKTGTVRKQLTLESASSLDIVISTTDCTNCQLTLSNIKLQQSVEKIQSVDTNKCLQPEQCYRLSTEQPYCRECFVGYLYDPQQNWCTCPYTFYHDQGQTQMAVCNKCAPSCLICQSPTNCQYCQEGKQVINGMCVCKSGIALGSICIQCQSFCQKCQSVTVCEKCIQQVTQNGVKVPTWRTKDPATGKCECMKGYYNVGQQIVCYACPEKCLQCYFRGECSICMDGYGVEMVSYTCIKCKDASCIKCSQAADSCTKCAAGKVVLEGACVTSCPAKYFLSAQTCVACPEGCAKCTAIGKCSECLPKYIMQPLVPLCASTCPSGFFVSNSKCMACDKSCGTCYGTATVCTSCTSGVLTNGKCACQGKKLKTSIRSSLKISDTRYQLQVSLNYLPNLSTSALSSFYTVSLPRGTRLTIRKLMNQVEQGIGIVIDFSVKPPRQTVVVLKFNVGLLSSAYKKAGCIDLSSGDLRFAVKSVKNYFG